MMKKPMAVLFFVMCALTAYAQDDPRMDDKHEIKTNAFNLILFKAPQFSYEYLINEESSFGASIMFNLVETEDGSWSDEPYYYERFAFTPYYRRFISSKYARGFFFEAFGMYNVQGDYDGDWDSNGGITYSDETSGNLAFGIALGGKLVSKGGFLLEFYGGVGRNIITGNQNFANDFVPRAGLSLGYRF
ncbi:DUF3575 domain-containing protein [Maribacter sp. 2307ULW6-5]|uniref:DUF3575 domain-containing protein n=1 Tax=Maribacter sp. 2307ULW6-5 TaxID=3386275 RepID=UPI0039BCD7D8